jgi:hypothetical protein
MESSLDSFPGLSGALACQLFWPCLVTNSHYVKGALNAPLNLIWKLPGVPIWDDLNILIIICYLSFQKDGRKLFALLLGNTLFKPIW